MSPKRCLGVLSREVFSFQSFQELYCRSAKGHQLRLGRMVNMEHLQRHLWWRHQAEESLGDCSAKCKGQGLRPSRQGGAKRERRDTESYLSIYLTIYLYNIYLFVYRLRKRVSRDSKESLESALGGGAVQYPPLRRLQRWALGRMGSTLAASIDSSRPQSTLLNLDDDFT